LERNADVVNMASYAPLFAHEEGWQWTPDLIWVNNLQSYGTPNYYVQKMFSLNKGTDVVTITLNNEVVAGQDSLYASAQLDKKSKELIIKLVNASSKKQKNTIQLKGVEVGTATMYVMQSNDLDAVNSFASPLNISPRLKSVDVKGPTFSLEAQPYSFSVIRVKVF